MKKTLIAFVILLVCCKSYSQNDSINRLEEVWIQADRKLEKHSVGYKVVTLSQATILKNMESFSSLLRFTAPIHLREYGAGGTSTASFRGTSSSNTAVIWNGININSVNNGQTSFNALTVSLFDNIDIRAGGGSIEYGSGAIGGTIHLNDNLKFSNSKLIRNQAVFNFGSFETYQGLYKIKVSNTNFALNAGITYNQSENDYRWLGTNFRNLNGGYKNGGFNLSSALKLSKFSKLKFYTANYRGDRLFSGTLPNPASANDRNKDFNHRNLLVYTNESKWIDQEAKVAYLIQEYRYFGDKDSDFFNFGKSKRAIINYNLSYSLPKLRSTITSYSEYESAFGKTDQIAERHRKQFSQSFVYNQTITNRILVDAKIRKDLNSDFKVPFTYALGITYKPFESWFLRTNGSKNYRVPTYNDLFWPGQGNLDLVPETALQGELGFGYKTNKFLMDVGVFYIGAKDKIVWRPNGDPERPGVWVPINLAEVTNTGVELLLNYKKQFNAHKIQCNLNYSYTSSINGATDKQVIFIPKHLFNLNITDSYKRLNFLYQQLYSGKVFTTDSNSPDFVVPQYFVANLGAYYRLLETNAQQLTVGLKVNNVLNESYVTQPRRPMPNRNFNFNINYKF